MADVIGGLSTSHVPMIGKAIAANRQGEVSFKPFFDGFAPVRDWVAGARPDVAVVIYNDHGLNFFRSRRRARLFQRRRGLGSARASRFSRRASPRLAHREQPRHR